MTSSLLKQFFGRPSGSFVRSARARGLKARVAKALDPAAREIAPQDPGSILDSRELFEQAAMRAVIGDAGNLELSFGLVDMLASAVESLGLARSSDVLDPFRRVWVENAQERRTRGVVLTCERAEISVFCPPGGESIARIGSPLHLRYRGFSSPVDYELLLNDAVRLPGAHVLHLTRLDGSGAIGRASDRCLVAIGAVARLLPGNEEDAPEPFMDCEVLDLSPGGLQFFGQGSYENGDIIGLEVQLPDGTPEAFHVKGTVSWIGGQTDGGRAHGLMFQGLTARDEERLEMYLRGLRNQTLPSTSH